jgi:putative phosphoesterase
METKPLLVVGVVADTHVPDRVDRMHPALISTLKAAGVQRILHAGDISVPSVLDELGKIAPVTAVRGNRDWAFHGSLAMAEKMELAGVKVALMHGHGSLGRYLSDKVTYWTMGYRFERYQVWLARMAPDAQVIIFGHTHRMVNRQVGKTLYFNPGSACVSDVHGTLPTIGFLRIFAGQRVEAEIIELPGYCLEKGHWVARI